MPVLAQKGDKALIMDNKVQATLFWKTPVDLDLYCMYLPKGSPAPTQEKKGFFSKLVGGGSRGGTSGAGQINFQRKGSLSRPPYIKLDQDSGIGDKVDSAQGNEENMHFGDLGAVDCALIVANIYGKSTNFAQYEGKVIVKGMGEPLEVPLSETKKGSWCVVAMIDNRTGTPHLVNVNKTMSKKPDIVDFMI